MISWPISFGEAADRLTILQLKRERIRDSSKLASIEAELALVEPLLFEHLQRTADFETLFTRLKEINARLWDIEEDIRQHERAGNFGAEFVTLARSVYLCNHERFRLKREIDQLLGSKIREEKSYSDVESSAGSAQSPAPAED